MAPRDPRLARRGARVVPCDRDDPGPAAHASSLRNPHPPATMRPRPAPLLLAALLLAAPASAQAPISVVRGFDVYRSRELDTAELHRRHAPLLDSVRAAGATGDMEAFGEALGALGRAVRDAGRFAFLDLAPIQYPEGDTAVWYVTVDVVDSLDLDRLVFDVEPTGQVEGLDSLLAAWRRFEEDGFARRAFWSPGQPCPAFHCIFTFQDDLAPYETRFREGALAHADALERMLATDADFADRGHAAYLLAHHPDEGRVARAMIARLTDPSSFVRNNAARVLAFMARETDTKAVPLEPFLRLIDGPTTTDRNKALAVLDGLARDPAHHRTIRERAGAWLLELLALEQPNNHEFAWSILKRISGEAYGARDYAAWRRWLS